MDERPKLIIIAGPTAVGKTKLSIELAKRINGEIISADSMQVYKYMDIGSAKVLPEEMDGIEHHLIDVLEPISEFNVVLFQSMAKEALKKIYEKGKIPILVGGTGFYIQALLNDIDFTENEDDKSYRGQLWEIAQKEGNEALFSMLEKIDPDAADSIHKNNVKRMIRALEYYHLTGECISKHNEIEREKNSAYNSLFFVITDERNRMYERIDQRVEKMIHDGLVNEVQKLKEMGLTKDSVSMKGLGYKEILEYLDNSCSLEEAIYTIKRDTRHFAKRQLTWFKREKEVIWLSREKYGTEDEGLLNEILKHFAECLTERNNES